MPFVDVDKNLKDSNFCTGCDWLKLVKKGIDYYSECEDSKSCGNEDARYCNSLSYKNNNPEKNEWFCILLQLKLNTGVKPIRPKKCKDSLNFTLNTKKGC